METVEKKYAKISYGGLIIFGLQSFTNARYSTAISIYWETECGPSSRTQEVKNSLSDRHSTTRFIVYWASRCNEQIAKSSVL